MVINNFLGLGAGGFHRVAYTEWGEENPDRTVICVHGLTRNGRDFDVLAAALAGDGWRVVCPDIVGRGRSDWLADGGGYGYPQYLADMAGLIARLGVERVAWIGTSMGGLIGMMLAAQPQSPIARLIVNDIGPFIPKGALERISAYVGRAPDFADVAVAEAYLRDVHAPFGPLSDSQWRHLAEHSVRPREDGRLVLHYDPRIAEAFTAAPLEDVDLWAVWDRVTQPTLALRGAESDLLSAETAAGMSQRGPGARIEVIAGCGHAPALMAADQVELVRAWLAAA